MSEQLCSAPVEAAGWSINAIIFMKFDHDESDAVDDNEEARMGAAGWSIKAIIMMKDNGYDKGSNYDDDDDDDDDDGNDNDDDDWPPVPLWRR